VVFLSISAKRFWLLIGLTAVCAVLMMALLFVCLGKFFGRSPGREFATLINNADPGQIQAWAVKTLEEFPGGTNGVFYDPGISNYGERLVFSNAPAFLKRIPTFGAVGPVVVISSRDNEGKRHVELVYFYGGWGNGQSIVAGPPEFTIATNLQCLYWAPGVYYCTW